MKKNQRLVWLFKAVCILCCMNLQAQYQHSFQSKFIAAKFTDTSENKALDVACYVFTKDTTDFPPGFNPPAQCTLFENGREKVVQINPHNLSMLICGESVENKNKTIYEVVKNKVDLKNMKT